MDAADLSCISSWPGETNYQALLLIAVRNCTHGRPVGGLTVVLEAVVVKIVVVVMMVAEVVR